MIYYRIDELRAVSSIYMATGPGRRDVESRSLWRNHKIRLTKPDDGIVGFEGGEVIFRMVHIAGVYHYAVERMDIHSGNQPGRYWDFPTTQHLPLAFTRLKDLTISNCKSLPSDMYTFSDWKNLQTLTMCHCRGLKLSEAQQSCLVKVKTVSINECEGIRPSSFRYLQGLSELRLFGRSLVGDGWMSELMQHRQYKTVTGYQQTLKVLDICCNDLKRDDVATVLQLAPLLYTNLEVIELSPEPSRDWSFINGLYGDERRNSVRHIYISTFQFPTDPMVAVRLMLVFPGLTNINHCRNQQVPTVVKQMQLINQSGAGILTPEAYWSIPLVASYLKSDKLLATTTGKRSKHTPDGIWPLVIYPGNRKMVGNDTDRHSRLYILVRYSVDVICKYISTRKASKRDDPFRQTKKARVQY